MAPQSDPTELAPPQVLRLALRGPDDVGSWLDETLPNLVAAAQLAATEPPEAARHAITIAHSLSWALRKRGEFHREHVLATSAVAAAERLGEPHTLRGALIYLGRVEIYLAEYDSALGHINRALDSAIADDDLYVQIAALNDLCLAAVKQDDLPQARRLLLDCLERGTPIEGWQRVGATPRHNLAAVQALLGEWKEGARLLHHNLPLRRDSNDRAGEGTDLVLLGTICCGLDQLDDAALHLTEGIDICEELGDRLDKWFGLAALTLVHLRQGRHLEATMVGQRCLLVARGINQPFAEKCSHRLLALAHQASREPGDARSHARNAAAIDAGSSSLEGRIIDTLLATYESTKT